MIDKDKQIVISPFDDNYPAELLEEAYNFQIQAADKLSNEVLDQVREKYPWYMPSNDDEVKCQYVVDLNDQQIADIEAGNIKLVNEKGKIFAQIRDHGRYSDKLPIKRKEVDTSPSPLETEMMIQMKAIQQQLEQISLQIHEIDISIHEVLSDLQNDRKGLYYSGIALYMEAITVEDPVLRKQLLSQAIRALSDASFQMTLKMQDDIRYLKNEEYRHQKRQVQHIDSKMKEINECFKIVHQASVMKAAIYCKEKEAKAMAMVLHEYSKFIEGTIAGNANLLAQCERDDKGTIEGKWNSRKAIRLDTEDMIKRLNNYNGTVCIAIKEKENESI